MKPINHAGMLSHPRHRAVPYGRVESALMAMHGIEERDRISFRGRVQRLQHAGLILSVPGRGRKPLFSAEDIFIWAACIEFAQCGLTPAQIEPLVRRLWNGILAAFVELAPTWEEAWGEDCLMAFRLRVIASDFPASVTQYGTSSIRYLRESELTAAVVAEMGGRVIVLNVSDIRRRLLAALDEALTSTEREKD